MTIEAGDVITTGLPEGVSAIEGGDTIDAEIEDVGAMTVDITFEDVDVKKSQKLHPSGPIVISWISPRSADVYWCSRKSGLPSEKSTVMI